MDVPVGNLVLIEAGKHLGFFCFNRRRRLFIQFSNAALSRFFLLACIKAFICSKINLAAWRCSVFSLFMDRGSNVFSSVFNHSTVERKNNYCRLLCDTDSVTFVGVAGRKDEPQPWMPVYARNQSFTNIFELIC